MNRASQAPIASGSGREASLAPAQVAVVVIGPLPPPVHGQARICELMTQLLRGRCRLWVGDISSGGFVRGAQYHLRRMLKVMRAGILLIMNSLHGRRRLYLAVDARWGLIYAIALMSFARLTRHDIFLHHHSFSYIDRRFWPAGALFWLAGRRATHIVLCNHMGEHVRALYPQIAHTFVMSNAWQSPPVPARRRREIDTNASRLRVGLLSNLCPEKGLLDFLELLRVAAARSLPIDGVLSGPPVASADAQTIADARREFGAQLDYRGPVYGDAKERFFNDIDVFLFPTRFVVEAESIVVLEAMSYGVPVIAFARGCIAEDLTESGGLALPVGGPFVDPALARIEEWLSNPAVFSAASAAAATKQWRLFTEATTALDQLLAALTQ